MGDLNEQVDTVVRKKWDRSPKIRIDNQYGQPPAITFEVEVAELLDGVFKGTVPKGVVKVSFDPNAEYPLLNPLDNSVISETGGNHMALQIQVYSLFMHTMRR